MPLRIGRVLATLGALACLAGVPAHPGPPATIVLVKSRNLGPYNQAAEGFRKALHSRSPQTQILEIDFPGDTSKESEFFAALERARPRLVVTIGTQATLSVTRRVHDVPVVFSLVLASGESGLLLNPKPPNLTGATMDIPVALQFERLKEVIPDLKRVGVIFNPSLSQEAVHHARAAASKSELQLVEIPVENEAQVMREMERLKGKVDVLWSVADSTVFTPRSVDSILLRTLRDGIPFVGLSPSFVRAGALLSFSCDYEDVGAQSAEQALEILEGKAPDKIAVTNPRQVSLYLNLNTARTIRLEVSQKVRSDSRVEFMR
jgi:putative ABC transport system substrate-binding protein